MNFRYITIGSNVMKLIRASSNHFKNIEGFTSSSMWQYYFSIMKNHIPVFIELSKVTNSSNFNNFVEKLFDNLQNISDWKIDINQVKILLILLNVLKSNLHYKFRNFTILQFSSKSNHCEIQNNEIKLVIPCSLINISNISNNVSNHKKIRIESQFILKMIFYLIF